MNRLQKENTETNTSDLGLGKKQFLKYNSKSRNDKRIKKIVFQQD